MSRTNMAVPQGMKRGAPLQVGFIPLADCAPLVVARESGLFEKYELKVELRRETTWANIRDRVISGDLDAAHAPATLPFVANLGLDSDRCACLSALVLSLEGNAITISRQLWDDGVRDGQTLRDLIYRKWGRKTYTFAVPFPCSPSYFLLRQWFKAGGIYPPTEVRIVVLPPGQMFPTLKLGYLDGYCVGEPWSSLAVEAQAGVRVTGSADLAPLHPEKVLMVRRDFAQDRASEHERLIAALLEACAFCDRPENHRLLGEMLCQPHYLNVSLDCFKRGLVGDAGKSSARNSGAWNVFHEQNANDPSDDKAAWVVQRLYELMDASLIRLPPLGRTPMLKNVFRRDIFRKAREVVENQNRALRVETEQYAAVSKERGPLSPHVP